MCERYIDRLPLARLQVGTWSVTQACALTGNRTSNLSVRRLALNPLNHSSWGLLRTLKRALSLLYFWEWVLQTGPHQPTGARYTRVLHGVLSVGQAQKQVKALQGRMARHHRTTLCSC